MGAVDAFILPRGTGGHIALDSANLFCAAHLGATVLFHAESETTPAERFSWIRRRVGARHNFQKPICLHSFDRRAGG